MRRFARLYDALDSTTATGAKVRAMVDYFSAVPAADAAWAVYFLSGRRLTRLLPGRSLSRWAMAATGVSEWLVGECYGVVGDGAETAALLLDAIPTVSAAPLTFTAWIEDRVLPLRHATPDRQYADMRGWMGELTRWERFTLFKVLSGEFRTGVSEALVLRAVARAADLAPDVVAARATGDWTPSADWYRTLVSPDVSDADRSRPYPFFLASPLDAAVNDGAALADALGSREQWQAEWKWDGIRAQIVRRDGRTLLWSRGEESIAARFPEIVRAAEALPDGLVLDGEVLAFRHGRPLPFSALQQRIGRLRHVGRKVRDVPVVFMAYDVLEEDGRDIRDQALEARRTRLEAIVREAQRAQPSGAEPSEWRLPFDPDPVDLAGADTFTLHLSARIEVPSWEALATMRAESRRRGVEGLMLKRMASAYGVGRKRGDWWKWKIAPHTIDAVLIYAQPGSGKRASLLTDYTFGLWSGDALVPVAKAYSGLTNDEIAEMDRWIRRHTLERSGPVRHVEPVHVFELGFEAVAPSSRHRSGVAVRFPRMLRWRRDKAAAEADSLETLRQLIAP